MEILNKFMGWYHGDNDREKEPPKGGIKRVGYILFNYTGKLVLINGVFLLCCIPVITIPAAITALNRYLIKMFRTGYGFTLSDYGKEFKDSLVKCLPIGLLAAVICFYGYYLLSLAGNYLPGLERNMAEGMGYAVLFSGILFGSYIFMMAAMLDLPVRHLIKNAAILILVEWKTSLLLLGTLAVFWTFILAFMPYSIFVVVIIGFSFQQLMVCAWINPVVERRIIKPYEQKTYSPAS